MLPIFCLALFLLEAVFAQNWQSYGMFENDKLTFINGKINSLISLIHQAT
jgi:hypothetical protein